MYLLQENRDLLQALSAVHNAADGAAAVKASERFRDIALSQLNVWQSVLLLPARISKPMAKVFDIEGGKISGNSLAR